MEKLFPSIPSVERSSDSSSESGKYIRSRSGMKQFCIQLDPGMAFGRTGDHPTTSMCLKAIETYVLPRTAFSN